MVRKQLVGLVTSDKMDKTINVAVRLERMHPKYGIRLRDTRKYMAHDEEQVARVGDLVRIEEGRKRSKNKAFELREVLRAAPRFDGSQFENTPFAAGRLVQPPGGAAKEQEAPDAVTPDMIAAATQRLKAGMLEAEAGDAAGKRWGWDERQRAEASREFDAQARQLAQEAEQQQEEEGGEGKAQLQQEEGVVCASEAAPADNDDDDFLDARLGDGSTAPGR